MIAISVFTYYDDVLKSLISHNYRFFDKWFIITRLDDLKTIKIIKESGFSNIELLYYDFYDTNGVFNHCGAIRHGQEQIPYSYKGLVVILDSQIYLPNNFYDIIRNTEIQEDTLYGPECRNDYYSYDYFLNNISEFRNYEYQLIDGYFQLYKHNSKYLYQESTLRTSDIYFCQHFSKKQFIPSLIISYIENIGHVSSVQSEADR